MKLLYVVCFFFVLSGCSTNVDIPNKTRLEYVADLKEIPQNPDFYTKGIKQKLLSTQQKYEIEYFRVWNLDKIDIYLKDAMWAYDTFKLGSSYGENLQLLEENFFDTVLNNSNFQEYATLNEKAITLDLTNIRAFPTDKPLLYDPNIAGEGFPFDYLQNSTIAANKPLLISHYSKDREWVFVESSFAFGWIKASSVVTLKKIYTTQWQKAEQILVVKEGVPIYDEDNNFLFHSRIGMMMPLIEEDEDSYTVLTIGKYKTNKAYYIHSKISKDVASKGILAFNEQSITKILKELQKTNYGWGGIYAQRDCSSTLRDFYAPFGVWLPRNSYRQSKIGEVLSLDGLSIQETISIIKENAIPFETLLYKKGHIVMYAGILNNEIIVFQNVWGVKTKKDGVEGRFIVGKPVFSTLEIGKNLTDFDPSGSLLENLKSLNRVTVSPKP